MNKIVLILLTAFLVCFLGCDTIGEDPLPYPGIQEDGSIALYRNGVVYNFDYTTYNDGYQLDGDGKSNPGSTAGGGYLEESIKAIEFDGVGNTWTFTLFDTPAIDIKKIVGFSWQTKCAYTPNVTPSVTVKLVNSKGKEIAVATQNIGTTAQEAGGWNKQVYPDPAKETEVTAWAKVVSEAGTDDQLWKWVVSVSQNSGRLFVDEVILTMSK